LLLSYADAHLQCFGEKNIDIHLARVPASFSIAAEQIAEDVAELLLPRRFRNLYRADRLRAVGNTRPLRPSTLADAQWTREFITSLNAMASTREEVVQWTC